MGTLGTKSKYTLCRKRFVAWVEEDNPDLIFGQKARIRYSLGICGEHIIELQEILDKYEEIPSHLVMETIESEYVNPADCILSSFDKEEEEEIGN